MKYWTATNPKQKAACQQYERNKQFVTENLHTLSTESLIDYAKWQDRLYLVAVGERE